jgi:hypothetical protein
MRLSNLIWIIATIFTPAIAAPIETQDHTPLYSLVVTAPCVSDCIKEGMEKLVFTQANFTTGNKTNTTMQNFKTASTVSRPVATVDFEEVSALPHEVWDLTHKCSASCTWISPLRKTRPERLGSLESWMNGSSKEERFSV